MTDEMAGLQMAEDLHLAEPLPRDADLEEAILRSMQEASLAEAYLRLAGVAPSVLTASPQPDAAGSAFAEEGKREEERDRHRETRDGASSLSSLPREDVCESACVTAGSCRLSHMQSDCM